MIAHELTGIVWRKSSYSGHEACVEVAAAGGDVPVRLRLGPPRVVAGLAGDVAAGWDQAGVPS